MRRASCLLLSAFNPFMGGDGQAVCGSKDFSLYFHTVMC